MARRATVLQRLRQDAAVPCLYLVGADEFAPDAELPDPAKTGRATPDTVRTAYDALSVDCGVLSPAAVSWFGTAPQHFVPMNDKPIVRRLTVGGVSVAVIFFPPLSTGGTTETETPTPKLLASVLAAADSAADATFRIGVSSWGFQGEYEARAALSQRFHMLLGAGPGAAFSGELDPVTPSMVWSRADRDGRSLMVLDVLSLPEPGEPWALGLSLQTREERLTSDVPADPRMERVIGSFPQP